MQGFWKGNKKPEGRLLRSISDLNIADLSFWCPGWIPPSSHHHFPSTAEEWVLHWETFTFNGIPRCINSECKGVIKYSSSCKWNGTKEWFSGCSGSPQCRGGGKALGPEQGLQGPFMTCSCSATKFYQIIKLVRFQRTDSCGSNPEESNKWTGRLNLQMYRAS